MARKPDDISPIHHFNVDAQTSNIFLMGEDGYVSHESGMEPGVEYIMANRFIKNMNICLRTNPSKPILIHMKTCGGLWEEGMAIHNTIRACPVPVTILNYTHARSMSSMIFLAASKRIMMPDSYFMFHEGTLSGDGTYKQVMTMAAWEKKGRTRMVEIYVKALKEQGKFKHFSEEKLRRMLTHMMDKKEDVFLSAQEAVEWGFADEIFGEGEFGFDWSKLTEYTDTQLAR